MAETSASEPVPRKRRIPLRPLLAVAVLAAAIIAWLLLRGDGRSDEARFTGYVVSDNLYMASPIAGTVAWIGVKSGDRVRPGTPLFRIDPTNLAARVGEARAQVDESVARVAEQQAALARARANLAAAQADADRIATELTRLTAAQAEKPGSVARLEIDQARAAHRAALKRRDAARTEMSAADAAIASAEAQTAEERAGVTQATRQLEELSPTAPAAGWVEDVMYQPGEWVAANAPLVSIVPANEVKVRFYVPQGVVNAYRPGARVAIACDGCPSGLTATVDYVAPRPEFTPPVIFSLESRDKLVFMVEALPSRPQALVPGQPIDVTPLASGRR